MKSQNQRILSFLKTGRSITPLSALNMFGCFRLSARIHDLKGQGFNISTEKYKVYKSNKIVAKYKLIQDENN